MVRIICPRCNKVTSVMDHIGDYLCNCAEHTDSKALSEEDVFKLGTWEDYTGSGGRPTNFSRASENKLQGRRGEVCSESVHDVTARGRIKTLYRQRDHIEYIDLKDDNCRL